MAEDENKGEETPEQEGSGVAAESPAPKKAAVKKKTAGKKKKDVKKKAVKKKSAAEQPAAKPETTAESPAAEEMGDTQESPQRTSPPKSFWWRATIMVLLVILLFSAIRDMADGPEDETAGGIDTATVPAEVLEPGYATPQTAAPSAEPTHPWMLPPGPTAQVPGGNAPQPYYPAPPQQGGYAYPQHPYGDSSAAPQPYYPAPPQGYYGYPPQHPWQQPPYHPQGEAEGGYPTYPQQYPAP